MFSSGKKLKAVCVALGLILATRAIVGVAQEPVPPTPPADFSNFEILDIADDDSSPSDRSGELHYGGTNGRGFESTPIHFPHAEAPFLPHLIESVPHAIEWPEHSAANMFGKLTGAKHFKPETELSDIPIGIQALPERPPLLLEWNEKFLGDGFLAQGVEIPTGAVWRPSFWVFGQFRSAVQYFDNGTGPAAAEWANRLDLFGQLNLSGTERVVVGFRPFDKERTNRREFASYDFKNGNWQDGGNFDPQTLFFEGDFGEVFPRLDPYDVRALDIGFSIGRMPLLAQQGLLINEGKLDAVTVTRNTLYGHGNLNLRATGVYSWSYLTRNSPTAMSQNVNDQNSKMVALLTESDFAKRTINADAVYVYSDDAGFGDLFACGVSSIRRHQGYENTYNTSLHFLSSVPTNGSTDYAQRGELLFAQTSWTPHHTNDIIWFNSFYAHDQFTSPVRDISAGSALGQTGILYGNVGLGSYGAPLGSRTNDIAGGSIGYQMFYDGTRQQIIWETGAFKETKGTSRGAMASAIRYQRAHGQHTIFVVEGFVGKHEHRDWSQGARAEVRIKF